VCVVFLCVRVCMCKCTCTCVYAHTHTYTHTHTHTPGYRKQPPEFLEDEGGQPLPNPIRCAHSQKINNLNIYIYIYIYIIVYSGFIVSKKYLKNSLEWLYLVNIVRKCTRALTDLRGAGRIGLRPQTKICGPKPLSSATIC
jgi:hypothetical protein